MNANTRSLDNWPTGSNSVNSYYVAVGLLYHE
jgi:hypothetical protein